MPIVLLCNASDEIGKAFSTHFPQVDLTYPSSRLCKLPCPDHSRSDSNEFLLYQYNATAKEIQERLQFEHLLFALKLAAAGAIIALISQHYRSKADIGRQHTSVDADERALMKSRGAALCCWIAVCVCQIIDIRLQSNTRVIMDIGLWVRNCLETCLVGTPIVGWETYFSEMGHHKGPFSLLLNMERQLFTWVLFVLTVFVFVYMPKIATHMTEKDAEALLRIARRILPLIIALFGWTGFYFYVGIRWVNYGYVLLVPLFVCLGVLCVAQISKLNLGRVDHPAHHQ